MFTPPLPPNIEHLKLRPCHVPGHGDCLVPAHIVRIDTARNTHGWQLRFNKPWKFIRDVDNNPFNTLLIAVAMLASQYKPRAMKIKTRENKNKKIPTGVRGVSIQKVKKKNRNVSELYVVAHSVKHGGKATKVYVGTENTVTGERLTEAVNAATKKRKWMEIEHAAFG